MTRPLVTLRLASQLSGLMNAYAFNDKAIYFVQPSGASGLDDHGQAAVDETGIEIACSFVDEFLASDRERWKEFGDVSQLIGEIRFIAPPIPQKGGHFKPIIKAGLELADPKLYEVTFIQDRGAFGFVCSLKFAEL